jgi:hypothetical protein
MGSMNFREMAARGVSALFATSLLIGLAATPARAGDDGEAPIWTGLTSVLGFGKSDDASIDYRERSKLVLPPKIALPPPSPTAAQGNSAWPVDADLLKKRKAALDDGTPSVKYIGRRMITRIGPDAVVTMRSTAGQGPGARPCAAGASEESCHSTLRSGLNMNPLTWVGLQKKPATVLGPEPDRDWLTDPPKGYRAPVEGVGAVADTN